MSKAEAAVPQFPGSVLTPRCSKGWLSASQRHVILQNSHWGWMLKRVFSLPLFIRSTPLDWYASWSAHTGRRSTSEQRLLLSDKQNPKGPRWSPVRQKKMHPTSHPGNNFVVSVCCFLYSPGLPLTWITCRSFFLPTLYSLCLPPLPLIQGKLKAERMEGHSKTEVWEKHLPKITYLCCSQVAE